jgi:hypothetical protein
MEIDAVQQQTRRMQAAQMCFDTFVDQTVIGNGGFPAHAAQQANRFHHPLLVMLCSSETNL